MELWRRFTNQARRAILIAHDEASQMGQILIGTDHILLGLTRLGEGPATEILRHLGVDVESLRDDVAKTASAGECLEPSREISFTPEGRRVLQLAYAQSQEMDDRRIGTEHILLGLLREGGGTTSRALQKHGADFEAVLGSIAEIEPRTAGTQKHEQRGSETMEKQILSSERIPPAVGPYSQAVRAGDMIFCSGVIGLDPETKSLVQDSFDAEVRRLLDNLTMLLEDCGSSLASVVKTTVFLADMRQFATFNEIYAEYFDAEPPARSTVQAAALPLGAQIEVEAIALVQS